MSGDVCTFKYVNTNKNDFKKYLITYLVLIFHLSCTDDNIRFLKYAKAYFKCVFMYLEKWLVFCPSCTDGNQL